MRWDPATQAYTDINIFCNGCGPGGSSGWHSIDTYQPTQTTIERGEGTVVWSSSAATVRIAGLLPRGAAVAQLQAGHTLVANPLPQAVGIAATGFPGGDGNTVLFFDPGIQTFDSYFMYFDVGEYSGWYDAGFNLVDPTPRVGECFFHNSGSGAFDWTRHFTLWP